MSFIIDQDLKKSIEGKLKSIADDLTEFSTQEHMGLGLMYGCEGIILFLLYYYKHTKDEKYYQHGIRLAQKLFASPDHEDITFANGYAGFGWLYNHLYQHQFIKENPHHLLESLNLSLYQPMMDMSKKGNHTFLSGSVGIGLYYLSYGDDVTGTKFLPAFIKSLWGQAIKENNGSLKWHGYKNHQQVINQYDLGLSSGMAGIVAFLARAYKDSTHSDPTLRMLKGGTDFILEHEQNVGAYGSYFPYVISDVTPPHGSRLAWCSGDLGIGYALWKASHVMQSTMLRKKAMQIVTHAAQRTATQENGVWDACLCHGTSGIALLFFHLFDQTREEIFHTASTYWFMKTLSMGNFDDGIGGYKTYHPQFSQYKNTVGLLTGTAGIGLALISAVADFPPYWDDCLLL